MGGIDFCFANFKIIKVVGPYPFKRVNIVYASSCYFVVSKR